MFFFFFFFFPYLKSVDSSRKNVLQFNYTAKRTSSGAKQIKLICAALSFRFSLSEIPFRRQKKVSNMLFRFLDISLASIHILFIFVGFVRCINSYYFRVRRVLK